MSEEKTMADPTLAPDKNARIPAPQQPEGQKTADQQESGGLIAYFRALLSRRGNGNVKDAVREALSDDDRQVGTDFSAEERELLGNILDYSEVRVEDVMVPRSDIVGVDVVTGLSDLIKIYSDTAHSRMPIFRETLDDVFGIVHVKDVMSFLAQEGDAAEFKLSKLRRPILYVPPTMKVMDLLADMRRQRTHMAVVVDEYGGTDGLVTIEDLVEQIIGDIEDEHDVDEEPELVQLSAQQYLCDARMELDDLSEELGLDITAGDRDDEVDTIGGLLFTLLGEVPEIGTSIDHEPGLRFEVVDADPRRIKKVRLTTGITINHMG